MTHILYHLGLFGRKMNIWDVSFLIKTLKMTLVTNNLITTTWRWHIYLRVHQIWTHYKKCTIASEMIPRDQVLPGLVYKHLCNLLIEWSFSSKSSTHHYSHTVREFWENGHPTLRVTCHMLFVTYHMSCVTSQVMCHIFFFYNFGGANRWRVCY